MKAARTYIGIDPGITGAVAILRSTGSPKASALFDIPINEVGRVDAYALACEIENLSHARRQFVVEKSQSMPKQGVRSTFNYGFTYGAIIATIEAKFSWSDVHEIRPAEWKKYFDLGRGKYESLELARELFPESGELLKRKKDHNRAEALLLAEYGRRCHADM